MRLLYNQAVWKACFEEKLRVYVVLGLVIVLSQGAISCRKAASERVDAAASRPVDEVVAEAEQSYAGRQDINKVRQGIVALRQARADNPNNYELNWRLAKFDYFLGAHSTDSTEQEKAFREGIAAGEAAVKAENGKPDGHFWLGANYGGTARISMLSGLSESEEIKREMETVLKLNEGYESGSAYMVLGQVYLESPKLLGGDLQKAIEYLEKGQKFGPDNALIRWHLADAYAQAHRNEDARKQIDALLAMKPAPGYEAEYDEAIDGAKKVQEKIK
jgi:tetratricopeptide (TPR) repeat protein